MICFAIVPHSVEIEVEAKLSHPSVSLLIHLSNSLQENMQTTFKRIELVSPGRTG